MTADRCHTTWKHLTACHTISCLTNSTHIWNQWVSTLLDHYLPLTLEVVIEKMSSESSPVTSGVPYGSVLGALLFLLFFNDLPNYVTNSSHVRLFADDLLIYWPIDRDGLLCWEKKWSMAFYPREIGSHGNFKEETADPQPLFHQGHQPSW